MVQGDVARSIIAEQAGLDRARLVVIADDDTERTHQVASIARTSNPAATVLARVATSAEATELQSDRLVDHVVVDADASVDALIGHTLGALALPERLIEVITQSSLGTVPDTAELVTGLADPSQVVHTELAEDACDHATSVGPVRPTAAGCEQCLAAGDRWVHLRLCVVCGHVGCCDSSPHRHARAHFEETGHAMMRSAEPGEDWAYCFIDRETFRLGEILNP